MFRLTNNNKVEVVIKTTVSEQDATLNTHFGESSNKENKDNDPDEHLKKAIPTILEKISQSPPKSLTISSEYLTAAGCYVLADLLTYQPFTFPLILTLDWSDIGDAGIGIIAGALQSGRCGTDIELSLAVNGVSEQGAKHLADALTSGKCPPHLKVNLATNAIGDNGATYLTNAIAHKNCPPYLFINLTNNNLTNATAKSLIEALEKMQDKSPQGLVLILYETNIADAEASQIIQILNRRRISECVVFLDLTKIRVLTKQAFLQYYANQLLPPMSRLTYWLEKNDPHLAEFNTMQIKAAAFSCVILMKKLMQKMKGKYYPSPQQQHTNLSAALSKAILTTELPPKEFELFNDNVSLALIPSLFYQRSLNRQNTQPGETKEPTASLTQDPNKQAAQDNQQDVSFIQRLMSIFR